MHKSVETVTIFISLLDCVRLAAEGYSGTGVRSPFLLDNGLSVKRFP